MLIMIYTDQEVVIKWSKKNRQNTSPNAIHAPLISFDFQRFFSISLHKLTNLNSISYMKCYFLTIIGLFQAFPTLTLSRLLSENFAMLSHTLKTTLCGNFTLTLKWKKRKCPDLDRGGSVTWEGLLTQVCFPLDVSFQRKCLCFNLSPNYNGI